MKTRWSHYKHCCKKYGKIKWNLILLFSPVIIVGYGIAAILQAAGWIGDQIERGLDSL